MNGKLVIIRLAERPGQAMDVPPADLLEVMPDGSHAIRNKNGSKKFVSCSGCLAAGTLSCEGALSHYLKSDNK